MGMSLDQKILAALAEVRQEVDSAGLFEFYERLLRAIRAKKETLSLSAEQLLKATEDNMLRLPDEPYLSWQAVNLQIDDFYPWLLSIAKLFDIRDPGALDEAEAVEKERSVELAQVWFEEGSASLGPTVDGLFANALAPYLERAAELMAVHLPLKKWKHNYCPLCGGFPDIALWNESRRRQKLMCERCRTEWTIAEEGCVFCGEDDPDAYGFYNSTDDLYRVMVCDSCGYYLKMINQQQAKLIRFKPILAAERFLTPGLDLLAVQEGYTRPIQIVAFLGRVD